MKEEILKIRNIIEIDSKTDFHPSNEKSKLAMFPFDYFCAKNQGTGKLFITDNTYTIHHFAMSWVPERIKILPNIKRKLMFLFGTKFITKFIVIFRLKEIKNFFS